MADDPNAGSALERDLDAAFSHLESGLTQAGRAVAQLRGLLPDVTALADAMDQLEAMILRARPRPAPAALHPTPESSSLMETDARDRPARDPASPCLLLDVRSPSGSLDLKALDASVGECPEVVEVALLDYDGSRASLKVWVDGTADPMAVRESMLDGLEQRLAGDAGAEIRIELEQESAA